MLKENKDVLFQTYSSQFSYLKSEAFLGLTIIGLIKVNHKTKKFEREANVLRRQKKKKNQTRKKGL